MRLTILTLFFLFSTAQANGPHGSERPIAADCSHDFDRAFQMLVELRAQHPKDFERLFHTKHIPSYKFSVHKTEKPDGTHWVLQRNELGKGQRYEIVEGKDSKIRSHFKVLE